MMRFSELKQGLQHGLWMGLGFIFLTLIGLPGKGSGQDSEQIAKLTLPIFMLITFYIGWRLSRSFRDKRQGILNALAAGLMAGLVLLLFLCLNNRWHARGIEVKRNYFDQMDTFPMYILSGVPEEELEANPDVNPITGDYREGDQARTNPMALYINNEKYSLVSLGGDVNVRRRGRHLFTVPLPEVHIGGFYGLAILLASAGFLGGVAEVVSTRIDWQEVRERRRQRYAFITERSFYPALRRWALILLPLLIFIIFWATYPQRFDGGIFETLGIDSAEPRQFFDLSSISSPLLGARELQMGLIFLFVITGIMAVRGAELQPTRLNYPARLAVGAGVLVLAWLLALWQVTLRGVVFINPSIELPLPDSLSEMIEFLFADLSPAQAATMLGVTLMLLLLFWFYARSVRQSEQFETYFTVLLLAGFMVIIPLYMDQDQSSTMGRIALWIMFALGLNIVVGYAGLLDLGYVAFYALGAYTFAFIYPGTNVHKFSRAEMNEVGWLILSAFIAVPLVIAVGILLLNRMRRTTTAAHNTPIKHQRPLWDQQPPLLASIGLVVLAMIVTLVGRWILTDVLDFYVWEFSPFIITGILAMIVCALAGIMLGIPVLRLRGDYLAIVTLGFGEIISRTLNNLETVTGGPRGVLGIPKPVTADASGPTSNLAILYLTLIGVLVVILVSSRFRSSRLGRAWLALRSDEDIAQAMGIDLVNTKLLAFSIGASFAGVAGIIFGARQSSIFPQDFTLLISINVLAIVIIGGMASIPGIIIGGIVLIGLPELLRPVQDYRIMVFGALLVLTMIVRPVGLMPSPPPELEEEGRRLAEQGKKSNG